MDNSFKTNTSRRKIIDACVEQGLSLDEVNAKLRENNLFEIIERKESDWYESMRQNYLSTALRKKIIDESRNQGLSRFEVNALLQKNNLRCLNEYETYAYTETLGRKKVVENTSVKSVLSADNRIPREIIIQNCLKDRKSVSETNDLLNHYNYEKLNSDEEYNYKKTFNISNRSRESIILDAIKNTLKTFELNKTLKEHNLSPLSQFETLDYEQKKYHILQQKRERLIKECAEVRKFPYEINQLLRKYEFEELTEHEEKKIRQIYKTVPQQNTANQLSPQFQSLYKEAIKKYHPDIYTDPNDKLVANKRIKEINEAKREKDYFKLMSLIKSYESEDAVKTNV